MQTWKRIRAAGFPSAEEYLKGAGLRASDLGQDPPLLDQNGSKDYAAVNALADKIRKANEESGGMLFDVLADGGDWWVSNCFYCAGGVALALLKAGFDPCKAFSGEDPEMEGTMQRIESRSKWRKDLLLAGLALGYRPRLRPASCHPHPVVQALWSFMKGQLEQDDMREILGAFMDAQGPGEAQAWLKVAKSGIGAGWIEQKEEADRLTASVMAVKLEAEELGKSAGPGNAAPMKAKL